MDTRSMAQRIEHHLQTTSVAVRVDEEKPSVEQSMRKAATRLFPMVYGVLFFLFCQGKVEVPLSTEVPGDHCFAYINIPRFY